MTSSATGLVSARMDRVFCAAVIVILTCGAAWCVRPELLPTAREAAYRSLLIALEERNQNACELASLYRQAYPGDFSGVWMAAEAAAKRGNHEESVDLYRQLPQDDNHWEFVRELGLSRRFFAMGRLTDAEQCSRRALSLDPYHLELNERLGHLMQICGRAWEGAPHFFVQMQRGKCRGDELLGTAATDRFFRYDERLENLGQVPDSPAGPIRLAAARRAIFENRDEDAETILREILTKFPQNGEAQGRLGRIIYDRGNSEEFLQWRGSVSDEARQHPEVLFVEGLQARRLGQYDGAAYCFLRALELSPNHTGANLQMAGCLGQLQRHEAASAFAERAELLSRLEQNYNLLRTDFTEEVAFRSIDILDALGRPWEAEGWCHVMTRFDRPPERARRELAARARQLASIQVPNAPERLPSRLVRLSEFAAPRWTTPQRSQERSSTPSDRDVSWSFSDDAERLGIQFEYFEGTNEANRLTHIFNVMGAGLGAIDFDCDGWPDLYLAQANDWRNKSVQPEYYDRLFRNHSGERFLDTTVEAGLHELGFSHGVTVGDYDQDGFPDIYIGNLGPNTLYRNNGDGTFSDVTAAAGVAGNEWSTSSAFADLNGDGLPDLFVLNYTLLKETAERECPISNGEPRACTPDLLTAEDDRCYLNNGDGSFRDVSREAGIFVPNGKGLGIVVWDYTGDGQLSVFVANDTTPNFLLVNHGPTADGICRFTEEGMTRGVAFDQDGNAQASMGVAAGDANGDGRLDLFITNFFADASTLYVDQGGGFFSDSTRPFQLRDNTFWMLGFGCQFADFDGDRWEDLVATNGHVDQRSSTGTADRMPPQLFQNKKGVRFSEIPGTRLGPFFEGKYLGRGLAILDWNRDGRIDFAVSHIHSPVALVTNNTPSLSRPLVVRLAGRFGTREAIGSTIIAKCRGETIYRLLTCGDGFLSSNERFLQIACPGVDRFDELIVRWHGRKEQSFKDVSAGQEILVIEGNPQPITLREYRDE